jgi:hypothetical protein
MKVSIIAAFLFILFDFASGLEPFAGSIVDSAAAPLFGRVLFRQDGTFQQLSSYTFGDGTRPSNMMPRGSYKIVSDSSNPTKGTLELRSAANTIRLQFEYESTFYGRFDERMPDGSRQGFIIYPSSGLLGASNASSRVWVTDSKPAIIGFVVSAGGPRFILLRVVGPGLKQFGLKSATRPVATLHVLGGTLEIPKWSLNDERMEANRAVSELVGAFPLEARSNDLALLVQLPPGAYTVVAKGDNEEAAEVLMEVYFLPQGQPTSG